MPKAAVLRSFAMNHLVHHRGQLSLPANAERARALDLRTVGRRTDVIRVQPSRHAANGAS